MTDDISQELRGPVKGGKYSRWAEHLSTESLETLLLAIGVFGSEYHRVISNYPERIQCGISFERMKFALEFLAALYGHRDTEKDYDRDCFCVVSDEQGSAFSEVFKKRLGDSDDLVSWASNLSAKQLKMLLWQVGEYSGRVSSKGLESGGGYLPLFFDVPRESEIVLRKALCVIVEIHNGHELKANDPQIRKILGNSGVTC